MVRFKEEYPPHRIDCPLGRKPGVNTRAEEKPQRDTACRLREKGLDISCDFYWGWLLWFYRTLSHFVSFKNRNHWLQFESCFKSSSDRGAICIKLDLVESEKLEHRLSNNSPNKEIFERSKQEYEEALKNDGYRIKLEYRDREESNTQKRRNRPRKILWFNPHYSLEVVNNLGKVFFKLLKRNFPSGNPLHKIFNKNCVKLSYSCMPNINSIINKSNIAKLSKEKNKVIAKCNCRDKVRCPLEGKCKQECVVYKVEVYSDPSNNRNKRYTLGRRKGNLRLGTITIKRVSPTRNIGIVLRYLVMCGRSRITKGQIRYWNGK